MEAGYPNKLREQYVHFYGKLVSPKRKYVVLTGEFDNEMGIEVKCPPIKFVFGKE